jgi:hypothetical protein
VTPTFRQACPERDAHAPGQIRGDQCRPDGLTLRGAAASGLLFPQFTHPVTGLLTTGRGVVFQKQNFGSGFFLRPGRVGSFDLQANP